MVRVNGVTGLCITKLDVLDAFDRVRICVDYEGVDGFPVGAEEWERAEPVYEDMPGWDGSTQGLTEQDKLPAEARAYLQRLEELIEAPVHMLSTGPERDANVILRHPFQSG
jgi:adenylosuccinate synthase